MIILPRCNGAFELQVMKVKIWDFVWWRKKVIESWRLQLHPLEHVKVSYLDVLLLKEPYWKFVCHSPFVYSCLRPKLYKIILEQNQISIPSSKPAPSRNPWHSETHWLRRKLYQTSEYQVIPNNLVIPWLDVRSLNITETLQRISKLPSQPVCTILKGAGLITLTPMHLGDLL